MDDLIGIRSYYTGRLHFAQLKKKGLSKQKIMGRGDGDELAVVVCVFRGLCDIICIVTHIVEHKIQTSRNDDGITQTTERYTHVTQKWNGSRVRWSISSCKEAKMNDP
jgi:hypothetical protein